MKQIKFTPKQIAELRKISDYFLEAAVIIDDIALRARVSAKILSRVSCLADRLVEKETVKGKWKIGDLVTDEDGCVGVVGIRYADSDFVTYQNDAAHPNPKPCNKDVARRFVRENPFIVKAKEAL